MSTLRMRCCPAAVLHVTRASSACRAPAGSPGLTWPPLRPQRLGPCGPDPPALLSPPHWGGCNTATLHPVPPAKCPWNSLRSQPASRSDSAVLQTSVRKLRVTSQWPFARGTSPRSAGLPRTCTRDSKTAALPARATASPWSCDPGIGGEETQARISGLRALRQVDPSLCPRTCQPAPAAPRGNAFPKAAPRQAGREGGVTSVPRAGRVWCPASCGGVGAGHLLGDGSAVSAGPARSVLSSLTRTRGQPLRFAGSLGHRT